MSPPRGPGDVIGDCKVQFLDEIYQVEKPGARPLSVADGQFKRTNPISHTAELSVEITPHLLMLLLNTY